ncbi:3'-5' exoribonuclease 1-like [Ptychodera flava]|uniref:3'-5' exoribonuclease 1-like n=1 Tax=Ptychodera flava TaxID=63121 RepID=UPI003969E6BC
MPRPEYYLCVDLEATCVDPACPANRVTDGFKPEIIDIGAVLLDSKTLEQKGEFQSYCRPVKHPKLSEFCLQLTRISQETVDDADEFSVVWGRFMDWMKSKGLKTQSQTPNFQLVTDGPFDCGKYFFIQFTDVSNMTFPSFARNFVELKREYKSYKQRHNRRYPKLSEMCAGLGLECSTTKHKALNDAKVVSEIIRTLLRRRGGGYVPSTERMRPVFAN